MTSSFITHVAETGAMAPSADNCQSWHMTWNGQALELAYEQRHAETSVFSAESHATLMGIGAVAENVQAALAANGIDAQWRWNNAAQPYGAIALPALPAAFTAPDGPAKRHTNRLAYRSTALPGDLAGQLSQHREGGSRVTLLTAKQPRAELIRAVRTSSEARFCDRALHAWLFGSLRHTPAEVATGDGLDMNTLGLPPGGKGMMSFMSDWGRMSTLNRLGAYKLLARSEVGLISAAPALLCISGPGDRRGAIDAGRLLARVWSELNLAGIAAQPYYVVTDQINRLHSGNLAAGFDAKITGVELEVQRLLGLGQGEMLHMILRVGYPQATPVRSRRLPMAAVFTDTTIA